MGQTGTRILGYIPQHGHSGPSDGGKLNAPILLATVGVANIAVNIDVLLPLNVATYDSQSWYSTITYRYTPKQSGKYLVIGQMEGFAVNLTSADITIYKNGLQIPQTRRYAPVIVTDTNTAFPSTTHVVDCNGTTDYISLYGAVNGLNGGSITDKTFLQIIRISN